MERTNAFLLKNSTIPSPRRFTLSNLFEVGQVLFGGGANADSDRTRRHFGQEVTCAC